MLQSALDVLPFTSAIALIRVRLVPIVEAFRTSRCREPVTNGETIRSHHSRRSSTVSSSRVPPSLNAVRWNRHRATGRRK